MLTTDFKFVIIEIWTWAKEITTSNYYSIIIIRIEVYCYYNAFEEHRLIYIQKENRMLLIILIEISNLVKKSKIPLQESGLPVFLWKLKRKISWWSQESSIISA